MGSQYYSIVQYIGEYLDEDTGGTDFDYTVPLNLQTFIETFGGGRFAIDLEPVDSSVEKDRCFGLFFDPYRCIPIDGHEIVSVAPIEVFRDLDGDLAGGVLFNIRFRDYAE